jgi:hypothetical protein
LWDTLEQAVKEALEKGRGVRKVARLGAPMAEDVEAIALGGLSWSPPRPPTIEEPQASKGRRPSQAVFEIAAEVRTGIDESQVLALVQAMAAQFAAFEDDHLLRTSESVVFERLRTVIDQTTWIAVVELSESEAIGILEKAECAAPPNAAIDQSTVRWLLDTFQGVLPDAEFSMLVPRAALPVGDTATQLEQMLGGKIVSTRALEHEVLFLRSDPPSIDLRVAREARLEMAGSGPSHATIAVTERLAWVPAANPVLVKFAISG